MWATRIDFLEQEDRQVDNIGFVLFMLVMLALTIVLIAAMWRVFEKAGQPGWACLVPIYNMILLVRMAGKPDIWILYMFIPFVNFIISILLTVEIARKFGQGTGFAVGMIFLPWIFYPILGFGDARYLGTPAIARA
jgi:hypothetical protein